MKVKKRLKVSTEESDDSRTRKGDSSEESTDEEEAKKRQMKQMNQISKRMKIHLVKCSRRKPRRYCNYRKTTGLRKSY